MATHKSAKKRIRQNVKRRAQNSNSRAAVRTAIKNTRTAIESGNKEEAEKLLKEAEVAIQKAAGHGLYHKSNAGRKVSRLVSAVNKLS